LCFLEFLLSFLVSFRVKDFKELQLHIDELTDEKFTLQRCLEQQTLLADRLADENEALTRRLNETAAREEAAAQDAY